jgi:alpha-tubulin suppressor-like RCC1 family protein
MRVLYFRIWMVFWSMALVICPASSATAAQTANIAAGEYHSLAIAPSRSLWSWGYNNHGQLGQGDITERHSPKQVGADLNWVGVSGGRSHTLALKADGSLWGWGYNFYYQQFGGPPADRYTPTHIGTEYNDWVAVAAGGDHSLGLRTDGSLWSSGANSAGQCGLGYFSEKVVGPARVGLDNDWVAVAAGTGHSLAIKADGSLWAWGQDDAGQLGLGADTSNRSTPTRVGLDNDWVAVSGGFNHSLGVKTDGSLWGWGNNQNGQLGVGDPLTARLVPTQATTITGLKTVAACARFSLGVRSDGSLWAWGANVYGQLGLGDTTMRTIPTRVGTATNCQEVAGGTFYSLGLWRNGSVWAWGWNNHGQLGQGDTTNRSTPVRVPGFYGIAASWLLLLLE